MIIQEHLRVEEGHADSQTSRSYKHFSSVSESVKKMNNSHPSTIHFKNEWKHLL